MAIDAQNISMTANDNLNVAALRALQNELLQKIAPLLEPEHWKILDTTEILLSGRMRTALGRAFYAKIVARQMGGLSRFIHPRIELNVRVLQKHPEEIIPTFAHELAHIVAPLLYGRAGLNHQAGWRKIMKGFGYAAERTHSLNLGELQRSQKPVAFAICGCEGVEHGIKARRFQKMRRGHVRYMCLKCKGHLRLIKV